MRHRAREKARARSNATCKVTATCKANATCKVNAMDSGGPNGGADSTDPAFGGPSSLSRPIVSNPISERSIGLKPTPTAKHYEQSTRTAC
jgi:hypothetical protein